jgi:hypothetical protein
MRALLVGLVLFVMPCFAEAPELRIPRFDQSFGVKGIVDCLRSGRTVKRLEPRADLGSSATDSTGRVYAVFRSGPWQRYRTSVLAVRHDGGPVGTFGKRGILRLTEVGEFSAIDVDSHDRPVLAGWVRSAATLWGRVAALIRLTRAGELDADFGVGGVVLLGEAEEHTTIFAPIPGGEDAWLAVVQRRVDEGGGRWSYARSVVRIDSAGTIDSTYRGVLPRVPLQYQSAPPPYVRHVVADAAGRAYLCEEGIELTSGAPRGSVTVKRLTPAGDVDEGFGAGGATTFDFDESPTPTARAMRIDGNGRPVLLVSHRLPVVLRLTPDGARDPSWGSDANGRASIPGPALVAAYALFVTGDRYVVAGVSSGDWGPFTLGLHVMSFRDRPDDSTPFILTFPRRTLRGAFNWISSASRGDALVLGGSPTGYRLGRTAPFFARILVD